ncbi:MAG: hypothetical protein KF915_20640 [Polyangiaceae bacterium]|nr:hypothetical protein [Polyangiaceae bacterium]
MSLTTLGLAAPNDPALELDASSPAADAVSEAPEAPEPKTEISARPGEGVRVASGDFSLTLGMRAQVRATLEDQRATDDDATLGLKLQRMRVTAKGTLFDPHTQLALDLDLAQLGATPPARTTPLLDAFAQFSHLRDLTLRVGQYKVPFLRETIQADGKLELVDLSLMQRRFSLDRDVGLDVGSQDLFGTGGYLRYNLGVYSGQGTRNLEQRPFGLMYLARVEVLPLGAFDDYSQGDLGRSDLGVALGGAVGYVDGARQRAGTLGGAFNDGGTADYQVATLDLVLKVAGVHLYGAVAFRSGDRDGGGALDESGVLIPVEDAHNGWGLVGQLSYVIPTTSALVACRYAASTAGSDSAMTNEREVGGGVSYFFHKHALKLQADALRVWQPKLGMSEGTDQVRLQLQMVL